jgi:hypothetical protein
MLAAWVHRNCRRLVSVCRTGAGGIRRRLRIRPDRRGVDPVAEFEQLALDPPASLADSKNILYDVRLTAKRQG